MAMAILAATSCRGLRNDPGAAPRTFVAAGVVLGPRPRPAAKSLSPRRLAAATDGNGPRASPTTRRGFVRASVAAAIVAGGGGLLGGEGTSWAAAAAAAAAPVGSGAASDPLPIGGNDDFARELRTSVRESVVKGAQFMDRIDAQWEALSDKYRLGSERQKRPGRPPPKSVPPVRTLDANVARSLLQEGDQAFLRQFPRQVVSPSGLATQIAIVATTVAPAFARSLEEVSPPDLVDAVVNDNSVIPSGDVLNFAAYCHYKAYSDLWSSRIGASSGTQDYGAFKRRFEREMGSRILRLLLVPPPESSLPSDVNQGVLCGSVSGTVRRRMNDLFDAMVERGLVASIDVSDPTHDDDDDDGDGEASDRTRALDCPDLLSSSFSVALDGDVTLAAQLLLQEQGVRLYPNYARFALQALLLDDGLGDATSSSSVSVMDYYMDTDYNPDPSKFQVKEVLMNVEIDRS